MAISVDSRVTGLINDTTTGNRTWSHNNVSASARGAAVAVVFSGGLDALNGIDWGGQGMTVLGPAQDSAGETGQVYIAYLVGDIPSGNVTVGVNRTGTTPLHTHSYSFLTSANDVEVAESVFFEGDQANPQYGFPSLSGAHYVIGAIHSGLAAVADLTPVGIALAQSFDHGQRVIRIDSNPITHPSNTGWTSASDDVAAILASFREAAGGGGPAPVRLLGTLGAGK